MAHTDEVAWQDTADVAVMGLEMERILQSEVFQAALTMVRARIYAEWLSATETSVRETLHAEQKALERLTEAFAHINGDGMIAREAIKRRREAEDTALSQSL
jgi:hypothetical protein